jgi:hypothetical protein
MRPHNILRAIGWIEISIGGITLLATTISLILATNTKTLNVLAFVIITTGISTSIGIGILRFKKTAYGLLIYFSSIIILSKLLIFADIITLNGNLETFLPSYFKSGISILYHGFVILYLRQKNIKALFVR